METAALISEQEVAQTLGVTVRMLQSRRLRGERDIPFVKVGRLVRYRRSDVEAYLQANVRGVKADVGTSPSASD